MKQLFIVVVLVVAGAFVQAQIMPSFTLVGLSAQKVQVTDHKMTNLVFPVAIRTGIKVSLDVYVHKVKGVENVLELRAARPHFAATNLSVFGEDGRLYCFDLEYADSSPTLNFVVVPAPAWSPSPLYPGKPLLLLTGLPVDQATLANDAGALAKEKGFLKVTTHSEKMRLTIEGIYLKDSLLWLVLKVANQSLIPYKTEYVQVGIEDKKKLKRTAVQEQVLDPIAGSPLVAVPGKVSQEFALAFQAFTLARSKKLVIVMTEQNGGRSLTLEVSHKIVLKARELE